MGLGGVHKGINRLSSLSGSVNQFNNHHQSGVHSTGGVLYSRRLPWAPVDVVEVLPEGQYQLAAHQLPCVCADHAQHEHPVLAQEVVDKLPQRHVVRHGLRGVFVEDAEVFADEEDALNSVEMDGGVGSADHQYRRNRYLLG